MEGKGTYGIVYSNPRFPFSVKYNFLIEKIESDESIKNLKNINYEVSKIFFYFDEYILEKNNYLSILSKYNLPNIYFNKPLYFGLIDEKNVINSNIYTYKWSNFKYDFKKIISNVPFQITFPKGKNIFKNNEITIEDFYKKSLNIIHFTKYLNENDLIFDDFKLPNIIEVNETYKICDFSSILNINELKNKYNDSFLHNYFYYIYLPILNQSLDYYLKDKNHEKEYEYEDIYDNDDHNNKYIKNIIYFIYDTFKKYKLDIDLIDIIENKTLTINIYDIFKTLISFRKVKNNNKLFFQKFIEYLDLKYKEDNSKKIQDITQRINLFSLGIYFLNIFDEKNNFLDIFSLKNSLQDSLQIKILRLISYLILNFIKIDDKIYIFKANINEIIENIL